MPQMSPMFWLMMLIMVVVMILFFMILTNFFFVYLIDFKKNKINKFLYKWFI